MQFTTVRSKEKDYYIYLKSEKLFHSNQEHEKNACQLFGSGKNSFLAISSLTNTVAAIWRERKVDPCYLETKNVVHNCQEQGKKLLHLSKVRKTGSQQLGARKKCLPAILKWQKMVPSYFEPDKHCCSYLEREKWIPAIWRLKNVVHNCQDQGKRLLHLFKVRKTGSQQLGARKKCLPPIWKWKKVVPSYFEPDKHCCSYLEREKSGSLLFGD